MPGRTQLSQHKDTVQDCGIVLAALQPAQGQQSDSSALRPPSAPLTPRSRALVVRALTRRAFALEAQENMNAATADLQEASSGNVTPDAKIAQALHRVAAAARKQNEWMCNDLKVKGNKFFEDRDFVKASLVYTKALEYCGLAPSVLIDTSTEDELPSLGDSNTGPLRAPKLRRSSSNSKIWPAVTVPPAAFVKDRTITCQLLTNRASAYLRLKKYSAVIDDCSAALSVDPTNAKAWLRRGLGRKALAQTERDAATRRALLQAACDDVQKSMTLDPKDATADELRQLQTLLNASGSAPSGAVNGSGNGLGASAQGEDDPVPSASSSAAAAAGGQPSSAQLSGTVGEAEPAAAANQTGEADPMPVLVRSSSDQPGAASN